MSGPLTRILSDLHYGDRASRLGHLAQLRPLLDGVTHLVLNGDTLDTRTGPRPEYTAQLRADVAAFFSPSGVPVTLLTGNHDPDLTLDHSLDLAAGEIFVTHGDIIFDDIVPWGRDAPEIRRLIATELAALPPAAHTRLEDRLALWRRVAAKIPQRHQSEPHGLKYALRFAADTIWPPLRVLRILAAWRHAPQLAARFARHHRPRAQFILIGHTHRPGIWRTPQGATVINTGSFCPPLGGYTVDVTPGRLIVRRVEPRAGEFHPGAIVAEFSLAQA